QAVAHAPVDVQAIGCDFYAYSAHKLYGPTGIGALYARWDILRDMPPWQGGGDMIRTVSFEGSTWADAPQRFEAGTRRASCPSCSATSIRTISAPSSTSKAWPSAR